MSVILHENFKVLQGRIFGADPSQLIHTGALEVVIMLIKGHHVRATIHAALSVDDPVTSRQAVNYLALIPLLTTWFLTINFLGCLVACALLTTVVIS